MDSVLPHVISIVRLLRLKFMNIFLKQNTILFIVLLILGWQISGVCQTTEQTRKRGEFTEQELKLREELETDSGFNSIPCGTSDNKIRLLLYNAAKSDSNKITIKAKMICGTKEGTKVPSYLTVSPDKISYVVDTTRDKFGKMRLFSKTCDSLTLGKHIFVKGKYGTERKFEAIPDSEIEKNRDTISFVLRCESKQIDELSNNEF